MNYLIKCVLLKLCLVSSIPRLRVDCTTYNRSLLLIAINSVSYDAHGERARATASVLRYTLTIHMVWSREGEDLARADMAGAIMAGANVAGANVAGSRSQRAHAASVRLTDGISGSGFLRV